MEIKIIAYVITMAAYSFTSTRTGMSFVSTGLTLADEVRFTVSDLHVAAHADGVVNPTDPGQPSTSDGHGTWTDFAIVDASGRVEFELLNSLPTTGAFYLQEAMVYRAHLLVNNVQVDFGSNVFYKDSIGHQYIPADGSYTTSIDHTSDGFAVNTAVTAGTNGDTITKYTVITVGPMNDGETAVASTDEISATDGVSAEWFKTGLTLGMTYEVQIIGSNSTGSSNMSTSFHVVPQSVPNAFSSTVVDGKLVAGWATDGTHDGKVLDITLTAGTAIAEAPDLSYVLSITDGTTPLYKSFATLPVANTLIANGNAGWTTANTGVGGSTALILANGTEYTVGGYTTNKWGSSAAAGTQTGTPSKLPPTPVGVGSVGDVTQTIRVTITGDMSSLTLNGGDAIDDYTVTVTPDGGSAASTTITLAAAEVANQLDVDGLANGTEYTVSVTAANDNGSSTALSLPGTFTPRTPPSAPTFTVAAPHANAISTLGSGKVTGAITALSGFAQNGGDELITYVFSLVDNTNGTTVTDISGVGMTSAEFTGLVDGSSYTMSVKAINQFVESGPTTVYGTTLIPSIPPTVTSTMSLALTNTLVTQSHSALVVNPSVAISTGGYPTVGVKVTATAGSNTANVDVPAVSMGSITSLGNYRASTNITVGAALAANAYHEAGFEWANAAFQINLLRTAGVTAYNTVNPPAGSVEHWNGDRSVGSTGQMTAGNWTDPGDYSLVVNTAGNMKVYTYASAANGGSTYVEESGTQWTITGWGQTVLRGSVTTVGSLTTLTVANQEYRPFPADLSVNPQEAFYGSMKTELVSYSFSGTLGAGTALTATIDTANSDATNYQPATIGVTLPTSGAEADHDFTLGFMAYNAVYGSGLTNGTTSTSTSSNAHVTSAELIPTVVFDSTADGQANYFVSVPDWTAAGNWKYPVGSTFSYTVTSNAPTETVAIGGPIAYPAGYSNQTTAVTDILSAGSATAVSLTGLTNGTKYKLAAVSHANDYHDASGPTLASTPVEDTVGRVPYTKPTISWTGTTGTTMTIASNGSALDDTIVINLASLGTVNGIVSHKASLLFSTTAAYGGVVSPPFTDYIDFNGATAQLRSTSVRTYPGDYILLTENTAGATIDLSPSLAPVGAALGL